MPSEPAPFQQETPTQNNQHEIDMNEPDEIETSKTNEGFVENYYHHYPYRHRHHHRYYYPIGTSMNMQLILIIFSLIVLFTAIMMVGLSK